MEKPVFNPRQSRILAKFAETLLPEGGSIPVSAKEIGIVKIANYFLIPFDPVALKFVKAFLYIFEFLPSLRLMKLRPFTRLSVEDSKRYLENWENSRFYVLRAIFLSIKTLCAWGYFSHPVVEKAVGYERRCLKEYGQSLPRKDTEISLN